MTPSTSLRTAKPRKKRSRGTWMAAILLLLLLLLSSVELARLSPPGAPTITEVVGGANRATVSFSPPPSNGGSRIFDYTVRTTLNGVTTTATGIASPITVTGLAAGTSYTFQVSARTAAGSGPLSSPSVAILVKF